MAAEKQAIELRRSTGGVFDSVDRLAAAIKALGERHNLLTPGGAIGGELPVLHAAGISFVFVDQEHETYRIPGGNKLGIGKTALDRIAAAAGVRWDPHLCGRVDDRTSPYLVEYQAAGTLLQLDGTERMIHATKRIDLRAERGTPESTWGTDAQEIARIAAAAKDRDGRPAPRDPWPHILQQRQHILSLAETKARLRAIRTLGVRTSYEPGELAKGFAVLRLQFTGRSDDPEIEREVALMVARRALAASSALYGGRGGDRRELPATPPDRTVPRLAAPEPETDDDAVPFDTETGEVLSAEPEQPPAPPPPATVTARRPERDPDVPHGKGKSRGPASGLSAEHLESLAVWLDRKAGEEQDPKRADYKRQDAADCRAWAMYKRATASSTASDELPPF